MDKLIESARKGKSWVESYDLFKTPPTLEETKQSRKYIEQHPGIESYLLLGWLYQHATDKYAQIDGLARAKVLSAGLENVTFLNDFGVLEPEESFFKSSSYALLELGEQVIPFLKPILKNDNSAPLFGSEESQISAMYEYRRKDYAAWLLSNILDQKWSFAPNPKRRDKFIEEINYFLNN